MAKSQLPDCPARLIYIWCVQETVKVKEKYLSLANRHHIRMILSKFAEN